MKNPFADKTNKEIIDLIDEYIHSERDRLLMKRKYVDGIKFEPLSEEIALSTVQTKRLAKKYKEEIYDIINQ